MCEAIISFNQNIIAFKKIKMIIILRFKCIQRWALSPERCASSTGHSIHLYWLWIQFKEHFIWLERKLESRIIWESPIKSCSDFFLTASDVSISNLSLLLFFFLIWFFVRLLFIHSFLFHVIIMDRRLPCTTENLIKIPIAEIVNVRYFTLLSLLNGGRGFSIWLCSIYNETMEKWLNIRKIWTICYTRITHGKA